MPSRYLRRSHGMVENSVTKSDNRLNELWVLEIDFTVVWGHGFRKIN